VIEVDWRKKVVYEIHDIPELLSLRNHEITVFDYPEDSGNRWWFRKRLRESRAWNESRVQLISSPVFSRNSIGRFLAAFVAMPTVWFLVGKLRPDVIVTYAVPTFGWQTALVGRLRRVPVIYRAIDAVPYLRPGRNRWLVSVAEKLTCRVSSGISTHNRPLMIRCIDSGAKPEQCVINVPGVDRDRFFPGECEFSLRSQLGFSSDDQVLVFMGTLFRFAQLDRLILNLMPAIRQNPRLKLLIIGDGEATSELKSLINMECLDTQIVMVGMIAYDHLPSYLRLGSLGLLPFASDTISHCALPQKVMQYLACGLPVVAIQLEGLVSVVPRNSGVIYTSTLDELVFTALEIIGDTERLREEKNRAERFGDSELDWKPKIEQFELMLHRFVDEAASSHNRLTSVVHGVEDYNQ